MLPSTLRVRQPHFAWIRLRGLSEIDFFLPEDGTAAASALLALLASPQEVWISAYAFSYRPLLSALQALDGAAVPIHLLIDQSESASATEKPLLRALIAAVRHTDLTITTAGAPSPEPDEIWHWKGMVTRDAKAAAGYNCWEGSTNFSESAWLQGNSCRMFSSRPWAAAFVEQFVAHRAWARAHMPNSQLQPNPPALPSTPP
jgi:hypothetical protein